MDNWKAHEEQQRARQKIGNYENTKRRDERNANHRVTMLNASLLPRRRLQVLKVLVERREGHIQILHIDSD